MVFLKSTFPFINGLPQDKNLTIFVKRFILDIWQGSEYGSDERKEQIYWTECSGKKCNMFGSNVIEIWWT